MSDLVERLRQASTYALMSAARETVAESADEIERLRDFRDCWRSLRSVLDSQIKHLEGEVARLTLTDAERGAIDRARRAFRDMDHNSMTMQQVEDYEALCGLLERMR